MVPHTHPAAAIVAGIDIGLAMYSTVLRIRPHGAASSRCSRRAFSVASCAEVEPAAEFAGVQGSAQPGVHAIDSSELRIAAETLANYIDENQPGTLWQLSMEALLADAYALASHHNSDKSHLVLVPNDFPSIPMQVFHRSQASESPAQPPCNQESCS